MAVYSAGSASIAIRPDLRGFRRKVEGELKAMDVGLAVEVSPDLDGFKNKLHAYLGTVQDNLDIDINANTARASAAIASITRDRRVDIDVDVDTAVARAQIAALDNSVGGLNRSLSMVGMYAGAIGSIGVLASGSIGPVASLASALVSAAGALATLPAMVGAAGAGVAGLGLGLSGVGAAFSSMGQEASGAGGAAAGGMQKAGRAVESAGRSIVRAQQSIVKANRGVRDAEREVEQSQKNSLKAQENLTQARSDAVRELQDLNEELSDSALSEEDAALGVARAWERLEETRRDSKSSKLDIAEADLSYRQAVENLSDIRNERVRLAEDTAEANRKGIDGADAVVDAAGEVEQAQWDQLKATESLEYAQQAVVDAQQDLADAQRDLADAMADVAAGGAGAAGGVDKFAEALAKLSPNAREFVLAMQALGPAWADMRLAVQDRLFEGMGEDVTALADRQIPALRAGLSSVAEEINGGVRASIAQFSRESASLDFSVFLDNSARSFSGLALAAAPMSQIWIDLSTAGSKYLPSMAQNLGLASQRWAEMLSTARQSGQLDEFIQSGLDTTGHMVDSLADVGGVLGGVFRAADQVGQPMISTLGTALDLTHEWVDSAQGQEALVRFFASTSRAVSDLGPALGIVAGVLVEDLLPGIAGFISGAGPGLEAFFTGVADGLDGAPEALERLGQGAGDVLGALQPLAPVLVTVVDVIGAAGDVMTDLSAPLEVVAGLLGDHPNLVTTAAAAWAAYKIVPKVMEKTAGAVSPLRDRTRELGTSVTDLKAYYTSTGREISTFGALAQSAGMSTNATISSMGRHLNDAAVSGSALSRSTDVMKAGLEGARGAAGGLVDFFGEPWAVGFMAAGAVVTEVVDASHRASEAGEALAGQSTAVADAQVGLIDAVAGTTGALGEEGLAAAAELARAELIALEAVGQQMDGWISDTGVHAWNFEGSGAEMLEEQQRVRDTGEAYERLEEIAAQMGLSIEDVHRVVAAGGPQFDRLTSSLRGTDDAGQHAADELERVRQRIETAVESARRLDPGMREAADAVEILADESSSANDKLGALNSLLQQMGLAPKDAERAMRDASETIAEIAQKAVSAADSSSSFGDALFGLNGKLDTTSTNGRSLFDSMDELGKTLQNVAVNGGDTQAKFEEMQPTLQALQSEFGLTDEQVQSLIKQFGLVPDTLDVLVGIEGADDAEQQVQAVILGLQGVADGQKVEIAAEAITDEAKRQLEELGVTIDTVPGTTNVEVGVKDDQAKSTLEWWITQGFPQIDLATPTAEANLDPSGLLFNAQYAQYQLDNLNLQRPNPLASMDISELNDAQIEALNQVGLLDGQTPTPDARMTIDELSREQQIAMAKVFDLGDERPRPVASLETKPLKDGVNDSKKWLDNIPSIKETKVIFKAVYEGFKNKLFGDDKDDGAYTGGFYTGAAFKYRLADGGEFQPHGGYRLPTAGPGTDIVDGFLALDSQGVPSARLDAGEWVINGKSSQKYDAELRAINRGTFPKLTGYTDGGVAHASDIVNFAKGVEGKPYVRGGVNWGDCSGAVSAIARYAKLLEPFSARFNTFTERESLQALGFSIGRGGVGDLRIGWHNNVAAYGDGHTAATLPNGVNFEMGGGRGNGQYGGTAAGADDPSFTEHAYLEVPSAFAVSNIINGDFHVPTDSQYGSLADAPGTSGTDPLLLSGDVGAIQYAYGSSASRGDSPTSWSEVAGIAAKSFAEGHVQDILGELGIEDSPPALRAWAQYQEDVDESTRRQVPGMVQSAVATAIDGNGLALPGEVTRAPSVNIPDSMTRTYSLNYDPSLGAEQWRPLMIAAYERQGYSYDDAKIDAWIRQIRSESNDGDPNIAQQIVDENGTGEAAGVGLGQMIPTTWAAYRDPELPDDRRDPWAMVNAMARYGEQKYGSGLLNVIGHGHGYSGGGSVWGPGSTTSDSILARLSDREFVTRSAVADQARPLLERMNDSPAFASALSTAVMAPPSTRTTHEAPTYIIQVDSADEGIRKAEMMERRRLTAMGL